MPSSITPERDNTSPRIDAGATWFRDYRWKDDQENPIDIANYDPVICFFYKNGNLALGPYTVGSGVTKSASTGVFEIRIPISDTSKFDEQVELSMRVDMVRTGTNDPIFEYNVGEVAALVTGCVTVYPKHAGK